METIKWNYFQYRKSMNYPVYLRFREDELHQKFLHLIKEMGFEELNAIEVKKIQLQKVNTRILTVQEASPRLQQQINGSDLLDKYGAESLSIQVGMPVYTYRKVGVMALPSNKSFWDLALNQDISSTEQMVGLRVILVRFLTQALAEQGILAYWGEVKDDTVIIMKQNQSYGEAVIIDVEKKVVFSNSGELKFHRSLKIIRKDKEIPFAKKMGREDLISFLSVSTCLLSFTGIKPAMKKAIYELSAQTSASYASSENAASL